MEFYAILAGKRLNLASETTLAFRGQFEADTLSGMRLAPQHFLVVALLVLIGCAAASTAAALPPRARSMAKPAGVSSAFPQASADFGFTFVRIRYNSGGGEGGGWWRRNQSWAFDYPRAERHLYEAIERTTGIYLEGPPIVLDLTDEGIFEYPILYLCEPGFWSESDEEIEALQEYFARGGFMIIDDFHDGGGGTVGPEWNNFYRIIKRVFPDREPVELTPQHPVWSIYYDIDPVSAVSTKWETGEVPWLGPDDDTYYGIFDDDGRMMVAIAYNQDLGDGWEWPEYDVADGSTVSFQMAINFIFWALTH